MSDDEHDRPTAPQPVERLHRPTEAAAHAPTHVPSPSATMEIPPAALDPLINSRVGDYVVTERLGVGGMGIVYSAIQPLIGKAVAIKVLRPEIARDPEQAERLFLEAAATARVRHRSIIDVFNLGRLPDGRHYLVMELLNGQSLHEILRRRKTLPVREALEVFDEVLAGLGAAHQAGLVHRDLKPSNIFLVTQSDGSTYVKLLDFGLAKQSTAANGVTPQTRTDVFVGTPEYIAPEQAKAAPVGPYTDLYSIGVLLFELITGRLPFLAATPIEYVLQHLEAMAPAPSSFALHIPPELDLLILRLLEKDPERRPGSAAEVRALIAPLLKWRGGGDPHGSSEEAVQAVRGNGGQKFVLRLGTRFELGLSWITPALSTLRRQSPDRTLHLCFGDSPELVRQLRSGQLDCAVTSARLRGEWIRRVDLHEETYALVAAPAALSGPDAPFPPKGLSLADVHADLPLFRYLVSAHPEAAGWSFERTEVLGTIAAVAHRVLEGDALAVLPTYYVQEHLDSGRLVRLLEDVPLQKDQFRLIWRDGHPRDADMERLSAQLRAMPLR